MAGIDVLNDGLRADRPLEDVEVIIAGNPGKVSGTVGSTDRQPVAGGTAVLVPDQRSRHDLYRSASTDAAGQFRMENVPPGRYKLFAWEDVETNAWMDATFMTVIEDRGISLAVDAGGNNTVALTAIPVR
jgi:hypothetical protein